MLDKILKIIGLIKFWIYEIYLYINNRPFLRLLLLCFFGLLVGIFFGFYLGESNNGNDDFENLREQEELRLREQEEEEIRKRNQQQVQEIILTDYIVLFIGVMVLVSFIFV